MKKMIATWTAAIAVLASAGSLAAHHSLANFDTSTPIRVKGTVVAFERVNPHSIIFLDQKTEDGQVQRWAVDGPAPIALDRRRVEKEILKVGDVIEVCGFATKEGFPSRRTLPGPTNSSPKSTPSLSGRIMNGHVVTMPDGKKQFWSDYGFLDTCLGPGDRDSLLR